MGRTNVRTKDLTSRPQAQVQARFHTQRRRGRDTPLKTSAKRGSKNQEDAFYYIYNVIGEVILEHSNTNSSLHWG